jgi:hypothetical protein
MSGSIPLGNEGCDAIAEGGEVDEVGDGKALALEDGLPR